MKTETLIATSSLFAALASFWVSWLSYSRDRGRLDFYVGVGEIWSGIPLKKTGEAIHFKIINSGRRPMTVTDLGGDENGEFWNRVLSKVSPDKFKPRAYLITGPIVSPNLRPNGQSRVLNEGDGISFTMPLPAADQFLKQMATGASVYIFDSTGRKHYVPCRVFARLKRSYKERHKT
jgi:hypothetical protein